MSRHGGCRRHPGSGVLDLSHPDDAAYARSVRLLQRDSRERRWTTLGWTAVVLLMSGFILQADAFGNAPPWLADIGWLMMAVAGVALTATLTAHGVGLLRSVPETLQARRMRAAERRRALDDPALKESARDLSRARVLRAAALGGFVALTLVSGGSLHELDTGVHDLRGLQGMPTASVLAALTAVGAVVILASPLTLIGRWLLRHLGYGPEQEPIDATGLVDESWDLDFTETERAPSLQPALHPLHTREHGTAHSGWG